MLVRDATQDDVPDVRRIYEHYVCDTLVTMEEEPPSDEEIARRRERVVAASLPYLVAEYNGTVVGYAYAAPYRVRSGYRFTVEDSVYVRDGLQGRGVGRALLSAVIARCRSTGIRSMIAVIIVGGREEASVRLHERLGFFRVGMLRGVGFKHGRRLDTLLMQLDMA